MDLSSILPLLLNNKGANSDTNSMASVLSALNGRNNTQNTTDNQSAPPQNNMGNMASILSAMGQNNNSGGLNPAMLMPLLNNKGNGSNNGIDIVNLMSAMNAGKKQSRPPQGLKPIKNIVPNDILGTMVKLFNT